MASPLRQIIDAKEAEVARGFSESVKGLKSNVVLKDLTEAIERRDIDAVMTILDIEESAFAPLHKALRNSFEVAGHVAAARFSDALKRNRRRG